MIYEVEKLAKGFRASYEMVAFFFRFVLVFLILFLVLLLVQKNLVSGEILRVDAEGNGDFLEIQDAVDFSTENDTIIIEAGIFLENIIIDKSNLTLKGNASNDVFIDANHEGCGIVIQADHVKIENLRVENSSDQVTSAGLFIAGSNCLAQNCSFSRNGYVGVWINEKTVGNILSNCTVFQNGECGISIRGERAQILNCSISKCSSSGIALKNAVGTLIKNCSITSNNCRREKMGGGINIRSSSNNVVVETCTIADNFGFGIRIHDSCNLLVNKTILTSNSRYSIYVDFNSLNNQISNSFLQYSCYGVFVSEDSSATNFSLNHCSISFNSLFGVFAGNSQEITASNCFWGSPQGPYHPSKNENGYGNYVTNHVEFDPWLSSSHLLTSHLIVVDPSAEDGGDGTETAPFSRIQDAVDLAVDGSRIFLKNGLYQESVLIDKEVIIEGEERNGVVIMGDTHDYAIKIISDNVSLENVSVKPSNPLASGIVVFGNNISLDRLLIEQGNDAIRTEGKVQITNSTIKNNVRGIVLGNSGGSLIVKNQIISNDLGIEYLGPAAPAPRKEAATAFDNTRNEVLLFGGRGLDNEDDPVYFSDTWIFDIDTGHWVQVKTSKSPSGRSSMGLVFYPEYDAYVLVGGMTDEGLSSETWLFDPEDRIWGQMNPARSPSPREYVSLVFDTRTERLYLCGGHQDTHDKTGGYLNDIWYLDTSEETWVNVTPATSPETGFGKLVVLEDPSSLIWFGAPSENELESGLRLWEFNTTSSIWTPIPSLNEPGTIESFSLWFEEETKRLVVFGGENEDRALDSRWIFDFNHEEWLEMSLSGNPNARWSSTTCDIGKGYNFMFGGETEEEMLLGDTWIHKETTLEWFCLDDGIRNETQEHVISLNSIAGNEFFGLKKTNEDAFSTINAVENYWGNLQGPFNSIGNLFGLGDRVSDDVSFYPWLSSPDGPPVGERPEVRIVSINPSPALPGRTVTFSCDSGEFDGEIDRYVWTSSLDDELGNGKEETISHSSLSEGIHEISVYAVDVTGLCSQRIIETLVIAERPVARIVDISPKEGIAGKHVYFQGKELKDKEVERFVWSSSQDGEIYNGTSPFFSTNSLSTGEHIITFRVTDIYGTWSHNDYVIFSVYEIPEVEIISITPDPAKEGDLVRFVGGETTGSSIKRFCWSSSIDGEISNGTRFSFSTKTLSPGEHVISFQAQDENDIWSRAEFSLLQIDPFEFDGPDLSIEESDIHIQGSLYTGRETKILAFIHNDGDTPATGTISFYHTKVEEATRISVSEMEISPGTTNLAHALWTPTEQGTISLFVVIDGVTPEDSDPDNNIASREVEVEKEDSSLPFEMPFPLDSMAALIVVIIALLSFLFLYGTDAGRVGLLKIFAPFYTRLTKKDIEQDIKQQNIRGRIYQYVEDQPGSSFSEIKKGIKVSNGQTSYHLQVLEREGFIYSVNDGCARRFFVRKEFFPVRNYPNANNLNRTQRDILDHLYTHENLSQTQVAELLGRTPQVISYNIQELKRLGFVKTETEGFRKFCFLDAVFKKNLGTKQNSAAFLRICPECKAEVPYNFNFCNNCGHKIQTGGEDDDSSKPVYL